MQSHSGGSNGSSILDANGSTNSANTNELYAAGAAFPITELPVSERRVDGQLENDDSSEAPIGTQRVQSSDNMASMMKIKTDWAPNSVDANGIPLKAETEF